MIVSIPKVIHYCWFGGNDKPSLAKKCINSWKKFCPDYDIIEWNETNFDVYQNDYLKWCYDNKKWAFLTDYIRLLIVNEQGGIYFDTDVEAIAPLDDLLNYEAFYGFENSSAINTGQGFGAVKGHVSVKLMIEQYEALKPDENGNFPLITCPKLNTDALVPLGVKLNGKKQIINNMLILPVDYMNPYNDETGIMTKTKNTVSIHWYSKSWLTKKVILRSKLTKPLHRIFGKDFFKRFRK